MIERLELVPLFTMGSIYFGMLLKLPWRYLSFALQGRDVCFLLESYNRASGLWWGAWARFKLLLMIEWDWFWLLFWERLTLGNVAYWTLYSIAFVVVVPFWLAWSYGRSFWRWVRS